jgi:Trk K+ transport system NAD-binding subunit
MRIACIGQAAFGEAVLRELTERGEEVVAVHAPGRRGEEESIEGNRRADGHPGLPAEIDASP